MFERILLAVTEAEDSDQTIETVTALARAFAAEVTVYHARERVVTAGKVMEEESIPDAFRYGEQVAAGMVKAGVTAKLVFEGIRPERLADHVLAQAEAARAELIVIGGHHPHNRRENVFGDIGKALAHGARCPVLLMPSTDAAHA